MMTRPPRIATHCNSLVLFVAFWVYVYRDLWPLATYSEVPKDVNEGLLLWTKIVVLFFTALLIPLFVPNIYVPVDPKVCPYARLVTCLLTKIYRIPCPYQTPSKPALYFRSSLTDILALLSAWPVKWTIWTRRNCHRCPILTLPKTLSKSRFLCVCFADMQFIYSQLSVYGSLSKGEISAHILWSHARSS